MPLSSIPPTPDTSRSFWHPEPAPLVRRRILPFFLPQAGCPRKCIFCDQGAQTGIAASSLEKADTKLLALLTARQEREAPPAELAFYGGTFTALPEKWSMRFLERATEHLRKGTLNAVRCSTRPDALRPEMLRRMRDAGLNMVELGIQTFAPEALAASGRGYAPETAMRACGMVRDAGLELGLQLLPGLPGQRQGDFSEDVRRAAALAPDLVRLYPCLVFSGAPLAALWKEGRYTPWGVERAAQILGGALLALWRGRIRVGRIGVAHAPGLEENVLAGPLHPALGAMARSAALFRLVCGEARAFKRIFARAPRGILLPRRYQGEFFGHKGRWRKAYATMGLGEGRVEVWDRAYFLLF